MLQHVDAGAELMLSLPAGVRPGERMTALFPDSVIDGRLAAFRAVVETGRPFRLTQAAVAGPPGATLAVSRTRRRATWSSRSSRRAPACLTPAPARDARRWQRLFEDTPLGICVVSLDGYVLEANRVLLAMLDRPAEQVVGARFHDFSAPDDTTRLDRERLLRTGHATMEKRYRRGDGRELWLRVAASLVMEDGEHRVLSICEDVTEARRARAQLAHRADHDPLTGLPNRERLRRRLRALLEDVRGGAERRRRPAVPRPRPLQGHQRLARPRRRRPAAARGGRRACSAARRRTTCWPASAATSSPSSPATTHARPRSRSGSSRCWRRRSPSTGGR